MPTERPLILVVGAADTGRAPMTVALLGRLLARRDLEWALESAGVVGHDDDPAEPEARDAMSIAGLDIAGHRARSLDEALAAAATILLSVDRGVARVLRGRFPALRVVALPELSDSRRDIPDPFRMQVGAWLRYAQEIDALLLAGLPQLIALVEGNRPEKEQGNKGTKEQRNKGTKEQRNRGTEEQAEEGTGEQRNRGTGEPGNMPENEQPDSPTAGELESWRAGEPASPTAGELESWRAGEPASPTAGELESRTAAGPGGRGAGEPEGRMRVQAVAGAQPASSVEREVALGRVERLLAMLADFPGAVDWAGARRQLENDLRAIAAYPLGPADLAQSYTAIIQAMLGLSAAAPRSAQVAALRAAVSRLHSPITQADLAALSAALLGYTSP